MAKKGGNDPKGYNEAGKVSVEKSADGYRTDIRVGTGDNHSHTIIQDGQMIYDRGVNPEGNSNTFVSSNPSDSKFTDTRGTTVPDATGSGNKN